jgi:hypothetical protein
MGRLSAEEAQSLVLSRCGRAADGTVRARFVIQSCRLSPRQDFWVITANSEDYVLRGMGERCYVGVSAYLVDTTSGTIEIVGSGDSWEGYLQDKYDAKAAGTQQYVLRPAFGPEDKQAVIRLRQKLDCLTQEARRLVEPGIAWFAGTRRDLLHAQALFKAESIDTAISLTDGTGDALLLNHSVWHWQALVSSLRQRIDAKALVDVAPHFCREVTEVLRTMGEAAVAEQVARAVITGFTCELEDDPAYLYCHRPGPHPTKFGRMINLYGHHGFNVDIDMNGLVMGIELLGRPELAGTLRQLDLPRPKPR